MGAWCDILGISYRGLIKASGGVLVTEFGLGVNWYFGEWRSDRVVRDALVFATVVTVNLGGVSLHLSTSS